MTTITINIDTDDPDVHDRNLPDDLWNAIELMQAESNHEGYSFTYSVNQKD